MSELRIVHLRCMGLSHVHVQAYQQPLGAAGLPAGLPGDAFAVGPTNLSQAGMIDQLQASFSNLSTGPRGGLPTSTVPSSLPDEVQPAKNQ